MTLFGPVITTVGLGKGIVPQITKVVEEATQTFAAAPKAHHLFGAGDAAPTSSVLSFGRHPDGPLPEPPLPPTRGEAFRNSLAAYNELGMGRGSQSAAAARLREPAAEPSFTRPPGAHNRPGNDHGFPPRHREPILVRPEHDGLPR